MSHPWYEELGATIPKRRTISLTDPTDAKLIQLYMAKESNPSDVVEAALTTFYRLDESEIDRCIRQISLEKQASTEQGWRRLFWTTLADRLGYTEYRFDSRMPYGPLNLGGFVFVFLLPNMNGIEDGTLTVHVFKVPPMDRDSESKSSTMHYHLGDLVSDAVDDAIQWTDAHGGAYAPGHGPKKKRPDAP